MRRRLMRILFLPAQPGDHPSTTSRVLAYVPYLKERGWACNVHEPTPPPFRRFEQDGMWGKVLYYSIWLIRRLSDLLVARRYDVVFVQRDFYPFSAGVLERVLLAEDVAVVYDTDDALHLPQPGRSTSVFQRLRPLTKYDDFAQGAATVLVASNELAVHIRRLNPKCEIFPMTIDTERYARARQRRQPRAHVVVGWSGGRTSLRYLDQLRLPLAKAVQAGATIRIITGAPDAVPNLGIPLEVVRWSAATEAEDLVEFDVGLLPLTDTPFERGKFPYKAVQYGAAGVPIVASNVGYTRQIVRDGTNGFVVNSTTEWVDRLLRLIQDSALRAALGENALKLSAAEYSPAAHADRLDALLRRLVE